MENEAVEVIISTFGVDREFAHELFYECGEDLEAIRKLLISKSRENLPNCKCLSCGRILKDPKSIKRGYGEECFKKVQSKKYEDLFS